MIQSLRRTPRRIALVVALFATAACTGENLFSLATSASALGPSIDITAPTSGFSIALGDSLFVKVTAEAASGVQTFQYRGVHPSGLNAYGPLDVTPISGQTSIEAEEFLQPSPDQTTGIAWISVTVTDAVGVTSTDSVSVTITN